LAVAEHLLNTEQEIQYEKTNRSKKTKYKNRIVKEATELRLHHRTYNREAGFISNLE